MRARATQVQPFDRCAVTAPTRDGTHEQNLVESELSVVEALLRGLQLYLIRLHLQDSRNPLQQVAMRSGSDVLHVELQPAVGPLHFDIRRRGVPAGFDAV